MSDTTPAKTCWPTLRYDDAPAAIDFLKRAFGFEEALVVPGEDDIVEHAELRWPEGGGVMLGSTKYTDGVHAELPSGSASVYVVTDRPDELFEQAVAAGAVVAQEIKDEDYGSRAFVVKDPEGNYWSFGTYRGAP